MKIKAIICILALLCLAGCGTTEMETEVTTVAEVSATEMEHTRYIASGRYYAHGELITNDGNSWSYTQDTISERESYDHQPVFVVFDDNGTPDNIYDDEICGLVRDMETEIYDALEVALSDGFDIERNGNEISVLGQK